jgi:quercetin dioxygenase-like cupin family protein
MSVAEKYGAFYFFYEDKKIFRSSSRDLYAYKAYIGSHGITVEEGDSVLTISARSQAEWISGPITITSSMLAVVIRGYQCGNKMCMLDQNVNLPYINGCATRQIFPPERIGDPTMQQLTIPPYTSEQAHHIHSTPRVVYVHSGKGWSIVGQSNNTEETELLPGMVCILNPMSPHHFRTENESLTVIPIHVWSSTPGSLESNHPMFNGTKEV